MTDAGNVPMAPSIPPPARRRRRWLWILGIVVAALLILMALIPTLLSLGVARRMILDQVNKQVNGRITVDAWSLGWFSGVKMKHVTVVDAQSQPVAEVQSVVLPATVPGLLGSNKNLGTIEIEKPRANIVLYPDGTSNLQRLMKPAEKKTEEKAQTQQPLGFDVHGQIHVRNGELSVQQADSTAAPFLIHDFNVDAKIDSLSKPITLEVKAALGAERAPLTVNVNALVAKNNRIDPDALEADLTLALSGLDLGAVADRAPLPALPVQVNGRMDMNLTAQVRGLLSVKANGAVKVRDFTAAGGPLGQNRPTVDHIDTAFDVTLDGASVRINTFTFDSPVASASASGALAKPEPGKLPAGSVKMQTRVDLAALAAQLPHTLKLQEGLTLRSGLLQMDAQVAVENQLVRAETAIRIENVAGTRNGKPVALDQPIVMNLRAAQTTQGPELEHFELTSSFANARASGSLEKFNLLFTSDLQAAMREAAKFVDLDGKSAQGQVRVDLNMTGDDPQRKTLHGAFRLTGLKLAGFTAKTASLPEAVATLDADVQLGADHSVQQVTGLKVNVKSPLATAAVTVDSIVFTAGELLPALNNGLVTLTADLTKLSDFAGSFGALPANMALAGALAFNAPLAVEKGVLRFGPMEMKITQLDVTQEKKHLREPELRMTGLLEANPGTRAAAVRDLAMTLSAGKLEIPRLAVLDWGRAPAGITADVKGAFDLALLMIAAGDFVPLPPGTKVAGDLALNLTATSTADTTKADFTATVGALKITPAGQPAIEDPKVVFSATAAFDSRSDSLTVDALKLTSTFAGIGAKATLTEAAGSKKLDATGILDLDWDRITPLVVIFTGQQMEISGRQERPFEVHTSLASIDLATLIRQTLASAGIYIARVKLMGIETGVLDVPIKVGSGLANVKLDTTVCEGRLLMPLDIDATGKEPILTLPNDTPFLVEVKLSDVLADQVLSRVSPIFKGMAVTGGRVSILSRKLRAPLAADLTRRATFEGELILKDVSCKASGFLKTILDTVSLGDSIVSLPDQKITVTLRDGRLYESPIQISAAGYVFFISGSVGLDTTLDMTADLPVTHKMTGDHKDAYEALKGKSIHVPIKGTTSSPLISRDIFRSNIAPLLESEGFKTVEQKSRETIQKGLDLFKKK